MFNMLQQIRATSEHEQYHEAQRRAQQPQQIIKHRKPKSLLLPAPNNIIFELFNTIIKEIPNERLIDFINQNLREYLYTNWSSKLVHQMIKRLRREQAIDVRAGLTSVPVIKFSTGVQTSRSPTTIVDVRRLPQVAPLPLPPQQRNSSPPPPQMQSDIETASRSPQSPTGSRISRASMAPGGGGPSQRPLISRSRSSSSRKQRYKLEYNRNNNENNGANNDIELAVNARQASVNQVFDHIMWRIQTDNVTQATSLLIKLALDDGYKRAKLKSEPYDDVWPCFEDWRGVKLIKLYSFGYAPISDQRLVLSGTTVGDLTRWIANIIDGSEKRQKPELIRVLAAALRDKTKNCIFITNELIDAIKSLETGALRCVILIDRLERYEPITSMPNFTTQIEPLISSGKLFVLSSLNCIEFVPDPNTNVCC